jgi:hypothetical protein
MRYPLSQFRHRERGIWRLPLTFVIWIFSHAAVIGAELPEPAALDRAYQSEVRPLLEQYCHDCHGAGDVAEGDVDLAALEQWTDVNQHPTAWQKVAEMLRNRLMPPPDSAQPTETERATLQKWMTNYLTVAAQARAGDPGRVVLRRLSNAEYTYTIRDLTGVESLDPAREFPVDGAAGEGFTNTGSALVMSPALVTKYFEAAKEVAAHAELLPDGFRFSPHTTARDWTDDKLAEIRKFYAEYTDNSGGSTVNLQGIVFDTNQGGRLPLAKYLTATLVEREALESGSKTIEAVAREQELNAKYLNNVWTTLHATEPSQLLDRVRARWRGAKPDDVAELANEITVWQKSLWSFASVGLIGRKDGPTRWMEPVDPLATKQDFKFAPPKPKEGEAVTFSLVATDAGDGNDSDFVVWQSPRLVAKDQPDVLLCDVKNAEIVAKSLVDESDANAKPVAFGRHPSGRAIEKADLCVQAPCQITISLPAELAAGRELVTTGTLDPESGAEGAVQLAVLDGSPTVTSELVPSVVTVGVKDGNWYSNNTKNVTASPVIVAEESAARKRFLAEFAEFRQPFPPALCYAKIVPVDEALSLIQFYREDDHLMRLMLDDAEARQLDELWDELRFVSRDALSAVDAFAQLLEFASQDADPKAFEPMRQPINDRAAAFRQKLLDSEPKQLAALMDFAPLAYRRPLEDGESKAIRGLYDQLRKEGLPHDDAFRLTLARVLVSPAFLYKIEKPPAGTEQGPVSDWELASRLSYFLWSSQPDAELRHAAADGRLHEPEVLAAQTRRMLRDVNSRRLAKEFACHWLHINDFEHLDEKSERHFPTFAALRGAMAEESTLFFADLFQRNGSVLDILDADYTFLNEALASHYGIPNVQGAEWRRVDGVKKYARGGILAQATTLSKQSGASRTSPILRGNWISEVLLGERLPKPPKGVPPLPDDEAATEGLTVRQLVEKHTTDPKCSVCHQRIDAYGFSLEAFDAIGRHRTTDLGDRPIDTKVTTMDGVTFDGLDGLRNYLLTKRRDAFVKQFCRKLLGYALGRSVQLSDEPLLTEMQQKLASRDYKVWLAVESIVNSRQFRDIRGAQNTLDDD